MHYGRLAVDLKSVGQASRKCPSHQFAEMDSLQMQSVQQRLKRSPVSPLQPLHVPHTSASHLNGVCVQRCVCNLNSNKAG
ncbi:hypothetical protein EYF80_064162 [Liparis tanakae]|uniref:Uncharacterized protein n=1 Tax=Liparis tanakae TaxID=230148 RepID=A0A4Z2EA38_9TELE|nr:hypothetical protein EYF80_064162 [Liparis tanakae]